VEYPYSWPRTQTLARAPHTLKTSAGNFYLAECWHPKAQPAITTIYLVTFILLAAFVILSLFIGAICGGEKRRGKGQKCSGGGGAHQRTPNHFFDLA
jgi:hypothetical protein